MSISLATKGIIAPQDITQVSGGGVIIREDSAPKGRIKINKVYLDDKKENKTKKITVKKIE